MCADSVACGNETATAAASVDDGAKRVFCVRLVLVLCFFYFFSFFSCFFFVLLTWFRSCALRCTDFVLVSFRNFRYLHMSDQRQLQRHAMSTLSAHV